MRRFFWKGERRAERSLEQSARVDAPDADPEVDPDSAVLIGTYATPAMARIIADALRSEGIAVSLVVNGREGQFPRLNRVTTGAGLFVSPEAEPSDRAIARAIEDPVFHG
jgi:hypothetical protein